MKNFFKKLSFVLALAMVLTSIAPATASAATKNYIAVKGGKQASTVYVFIGGVSCDLDFSGSTKGTWKSADTSIAKVDKNGVITPVANGKVKISFVSKDGKTLAKQTVRVCTRAKKLNVYDYAEYAAGTKNVLNGGEVAMKVGEKKDLQITMPISAAKKAAGAKSSSYASYCTAISDEAVVAVTKVNDRKYTLEAKAAGEATITIAANQTSQANVYKNSKFVEAKFTVKVADEFGIVDVTAKKVNKLEVVMSSPVDTDDVTLSVAKGSTAVTATVTWDAAKKVATIETAGKMTVGTYVVTAKSASANAESSKSVEIENQYVKSIEILHDVALTVDSTPQVQGNDHKYVYVYYQVLDQYDEDITATTSIQWSTSCKEPAVRRDLGRLQLERTDNKAFTYGEQIFVTGVYTKTGLAVQKTLTVGAEQAVNQVKMAGFVKKNTSKIVQTLPNSFKAGEYYLVYDVLDQNDNIMQASTDYSKESNSHITFVSDNVLLVKEIKGEPNGRNLVIDGHEYNAVLVNPGDQVDKGGEVNITAIAGMTGHQEVMNYVVGTNQLLTSFTMTAPAQVIADGDAVEIPFVALDQNGEAITNFITIADNLNKLTFTASAGSLKLSQKDDGTAKLMFYDAGMAWTDSQAIDGIDRMVSLTSVVVGAGTNTLMLNVSDKRRPETIIAVDMDNVVLEGDSFELRLDDFTFQDQYGETMLTWYGAPTDNGFFATAKNGFANGSREFANYTFDIRAQFKGNSDALADANSDLQDNEDVTMLYNTLTNVTASAITVKADTRTKTAMTGNVMNFAIVKWDGTHSTKAEPEQVSSTKTVDLAVVDITQVKNLSVAALNTQYVKTALSGYATGLLAGMAGNPETGNLKACDSEIVTGAAIDKDHRQGVKVTGTFNGTKVTVPAAYYSVVGTKVSADNGAIGSKYLNTVSTAAIMWNDLYNAATSNYLRKETTDTLKIRVYEIFDNNTYTAIPNPTKVLDSLSKVVTISDAKPQLTTVNLLDGWTVGTTDTKFVAAGIVNDIDVFVNHGAKAFFTNGHAYTKCLAYDQYGVAMNYLDPKVMELRYTISSVEEATGYVDNNFTVNGNDSDNTFVEGAELGDTFVLTVTVKDVENKISISKEIKVLVGADSSAFIENDKNAYTDGSVSVDGELAYQTYDRDQAGNITATYNHDYLKNTLEDQRRKALNIQ